jgi:hypothetical protein
LFDLMWLKPPSSLFGRRHILFQLCISTINSMLSTSSRATHETTCRHKIGVGIIRYISCMAQSRICYQERYVEPVDIKSWLRMMITHHIPCLARSLVYHQGRHIESVGIKPWSGMMIARRFSCMARSLVCHQGRHIKPVGIKSWLRMMIARRFSCMTRSLVHHQGRHIKPVGIKPWSGMIPCAPSRVTHKTCRHKAIIGDNPLCTVEGDT